MRFKKRLPVTCNVAARIGNIHRIFSKDISGEGICLQVPEMLPEGSQLDLEIKIPGDAPVVVRGEVVWVKDSPKDPEHPERIFDTGIRFIRIKPEDKARLGTLLASFLL